jgi:hypothetical protein
VHSVDRLIDEPEKRASDLPIIRFLLGVHAMWLGCFSTCDVHGRSGAEKVVDASDF